MNTIHCIGSLPMSLLGILAAIYAISSSASVACNAFQPAAVNQFRTRHYARTQQLTRLHEALGNNVESSSSSKLLSANVEYQSLMVMDVVLFQRRGQNDDGDSAPKLELGAVQENGNVAPLSTWTLESAYETPTNDMMEFVVDEEDLFPGLSSDEIQVLMVLDGSIMSYGSRQVGGGKGPGNPHGEESEMLYYVDRGVVEGVYEGGGDGDDATKMIDVVVNPNLEHMW